MCYKENSKGNHTGTCSQNNNYELINITKQYKRRYLAVISINAYFYTKEGREQRRAQST